MLPETQQQYSLEEHNFKEGKIKEKEGKVKRKKLLAQWFEYIMERQNIPETTIKKKSTEITW